MKKRCECMICHQQFCLHAECLENHCRYNICCGKYGTKGHPGNQPRQRFCFEQDYTCQERRCNSTGKPQKHGPFNKRQYSKHYKLVRKQADWVQTVASGYSKEVYQARNAWMVRRASRLIAVWDGTPSGTKNTVDYATSQGIPVIRIEV